MSWEGVFTTSKIFLFVIVVMSVAIYASSQYGFEYPKNINFIQFFKSDDIGNEFEVVERIIKLDLSREPIFLFVSSTEYTKGDGLGSTIIKLTDHRGQKINTTCWESILYPNKSIYVPWTDMTQHWEYGNYYMDFELPETLGIYDQEVRCYVGNKNISLGKGFHVSNITNMMQNSVNDLKRDVMVAFR